MVNAEIISMMKRCIDELTDDEFDIIKNYCEQKSLQIHYDKERKYRESAIVLAMLAGMFKSTGK